MTATTTIFSILLFHLPAITGFVPVAIRPSSTQPRRHCAAAMTASTTAALVDMDTYNLELEEIAQEWTATLTAETATMEAGARLAAKSSKEIFVDTVKVAFPRKPNTGLGIELLEIAGGRQDGLGITVVSGLVDGGSADGSGVQVGDSIAQVSVRRRTTQRPSDDGESGGVLTELDEQASVETECLGYDATVEAIGSLPPIQGNDEVIVLTLKRLRRKPKVTINLQYPPSQDEPDTTIELFSGENLRRAMLTRGVKLNDALSRRFDSGGTGDCGGEATCSTCVVNVVRGGELMNPQSIQEEQMLVKNPKWRLACKAIVGHGMQEGQMVIRVNPRQWD